MIEVRDGRARNYIGDYDAYLYAMNKEIDEGDRQLNASKSKATTATTPPNDDRRAAHRDQRKLRKEIGNLERKIARLDEQKRQLNAELLQATDPDEALRLHNEVTAITKQLGEAEEHWLELQENVGENQIKT